MASRSRRCLFSRMAQSEFEQRSGSADLLGLPLDIPSEGVMSPIIDSPIS